MHNGFYVCTISGVWGFVVSGVPLSRGRYGKSRNLGSRRSCTGVQENVGRCKADWHTAGSFWHCLCRAKPGESKQVSKQQQVCPERRDTKSERGSEGKRSKFSLPARGELVQQGCPKHLEQHAGPEGISRSWSAPRMIGGWFCGLSGPLILPCHPCRDGPSPMGQGQDAVGMSLCNAVPGTEPVLCSIPTQTSLWEHRLILDESTLLFYIYWRTYHLIILSLAWCCSSLFMISGFQMNMPYRARIYMEILTNLGGSALCVCSSNF